MKQKLKNYSFWVGLSASIMLVVKFVAENFVCLNNSCTPDPML